MKMFLGLLTICLWTFVSCDNGGIYVDNGDLRFFPKTDEAKSDHWAVLVAGSSGWYNYRHQADACHAYQILKRHGFPDNRIITLMYDDIANNPQNPDKGTIINHINGTNVYKGVKIDYRREDVTPEAFLAVLTGDKDAVTGMGTGRVLESGPNDHVFVNFVDHGAPGILAFPRDELHATDLMKAIMKMRQQKMYKQLVFYIEACESGSMFHHLLPTDIDVYATTAANSTESSYACYMDEKLDTYLGDVYSVKWMEDTDKENIGVETLHKQYNIVKRETNTSHVQQFGNRTISKEPVGEFQGEDGFSSPDPIIYPEVPLNAVPSEDVPAAILSSRMSRATTAQEKYDIMVQMEQLIREQEQITMTVRHIVGLASEDHMQLRRVLYGRQDISNFSCFEPVARLFDKICYDLSQHTYALQSLFPFVNLCEEGADPKIIMGAVTKICSSHI